MLNDEFIIQHSSFSIGFRVTDGTRTRDVQDHNLALYQLSYGHRVNIFFIRLNQRVKSGAR